MSILAQIKFTNTYSVPTADLFHPALYGTVAIVLTDANTGQPTNGNNIVISYIETLNGLALHKTATIPGQSFVLYPNALIADIHSGIFNTWLITGYSNVPNPAPPVNQCDLKINYISVLKPESAPGANDAQISINATSSYLPSVTAWII